MRAMESHTGAGNGRQEAVTLLCDCEEHVQTAACSEPQQRQKRQWTAHVVLGLVCAVFGAAALAATLMCARRSGARPAPSARELPDDTIPSGAGGGSGNPNDFMSSSDFMAFGWSAPKRTVRDALDAAFGGAGGWKDVKFSEGDGTVISQDALLAWIRDDLFGGPSPFATFGGRVPLPWPSDQENRLDQVDPGQWVAYSRRQLCFIVAQSLVGAGTDGYANGLLRMLETPVGGGCTAATGDFGRALFGLLAACAADPTLKNNKPGPLLLVAKAAEKPHVADVRIAANVGLDAAGLRACQYDDGTPPLAGVPAVPAEGCAQPTAHAPGRDFMTGGLSGQAVQDISAAWLGGYTMGYVCGLGAGQDEKLMVFMPEVFALSFFLSQAPGTDYSQKNSPQLRQPAWILGARRIMRGLDGTARFASALEVDPDVPLTSDLVDVHFFGVQSHQISGSMPFVAFMSENQDYLPSQSLPLAILGKLTRQARENRNIHQRAVEPGVPYSFEKQVRAWYGAVALTSYSVDIRPVLRKVVKSVGTGPWMSGLWWGDSQLGFLAMWIGHAIAAKTWGAEPLPLDYYTYAAFTENPGNQCYVYSRAACAVCLKHCGSPPDTAFWLPGFAYTDASPDAGWGPQPPPAKPCVTSTASCGAVGVDSVVAAYKNKQASALWVDVEAALRGGASDVNRNVFDVLLGK